MKTIVRLKLHANSQSVAISRFETPTEKPHQEKLLKVRRVSKTPEVFRVYTAQVLSYIDSGTPALHRVAPSVLDRVDRSQHCFLRELGCGEVAALNDFRLTLLVSRRACKAHYMILV